MNRQSEHKENILSFLENKAYRELFLFYCNETKQSVTKLSNTFQCSRRSINRYISGERLIPMKIIEKILEIYGISYQPAIENNSEFDENGAFIWYGNRKVLFNILYLYRMEKLHITRFEAACKLNISEETLQIYENGKQKISLPDIRKIMDGYKLMINQLFPALVSYDGGISYLPLNFVHSVKIENEEFNLWDDNSPYIAENGDYILTDMSLPITRYNKYGEPQLNYMPEELTMDEYYNTDDLFFLRDDDSFYEVDFTGLKLPPTYKHLLKVGQHRKSHTYKGYTHVFQNLKFLDDYKVVLDGKYKNPTFDLKEYVFSDSKWYSLLRNEEYFRTGKLQYIGEELPENQCIVWEDGQYVRIIELYIDKYPYQYLAYEACLKVEDRYAQWVGYKW